MSARRLRAVLVGFGRIAHGYANDRVMARYVVYASHSQVLAEHPAFDWDAVVDPSPVALDLARRRWGVRRVARHFEELGDDYSADVAIIATPPTARLEVVERVKDLRGVLVEKPLGRMRKAGRRSAGESGAKGGRRVSHVGARTDGEAGGGATGGLRSVRQRTA